jgi:hypothetical protein
MFAKKIIRLDVLAARPVSSGNIKFRTGRDPTSPAAAPTTANLRNPVISTGARSGETPVLALAVAVALALALAFALAVAFALAFALALALALAVR